MTTIISDTKKLLNGSVDEKLEVIERRTRERLLSILNSSEDDVPNKLEYIVADITLKRFNRIGNEGMSSYSQEGLSMAFPDSDFEEYMQEINAEKNKDNDNYGPRRGRFLFI